MSETTPVAAPDSDAPEPAVRRGLSRRTIVTAAAWSVPAIVLATAAPAAAVSGTGSLSMTPVAPQAIAPGATSTTYTVTLAPPVDGGVVGQNINVVVSGGAFVLGPGPGGSTSGVFVTNGSGQVTFVVTSTGGGAAKGTIVVSSPAAAGSITADLFTIGFAGWGYNRFDQGQVTTTGNDQFSRFYMLDTVETTAITAIGGSYMAVLWADQAGRLWGRGFNNWGVVGWNGTNNNATIPRRAATAGGVLDKKIVHIARGVNRESAMAVAEDGTVWASGAHAAADNGFAVSSYTWNGYWQQVATHPDFVAARGGATVKKVEFYATGGALYLLSDGRVLASSWNGWGVSAQGTDFGYVVGAPMLTGPGTPITGAVSIGIGNNASAVVTQSGVLYTSGALAQGGSGNFYLTPKALPGGRTATKVVVGEVTMFVLANDGTVWGLGDNFSGVFGIGHRFSKGDGTFYDVPATLPGPAVDVAYGHNGVLFLLQNGSVWFAGWDDGGGRGDGPGDTFNDSPTQVPGLPPNVTAIGTHYFDSVYAFG